MRGISDRKLREPYRSWIDRRGPLPPAVRLLLCITFGAMGAILLALSQPWRFNPVTGNWPPHLYLGGIGVFLRTTDLLPIKSESVINLALIYRFVMNR